MTDLSKWQSKPILNFIFFIQLGLLLLMAILGFIGYTNLIEVGAFFFSIILGALGATVSIIKRITGTEEIAGNKNKDRSLLLILMPILYGTILSGVAYLLFMSGILSGDGGSGILTTNLFPNFTISEGIDKPLIQQFLDISPCDITDTGKLLVWCFIAGYSEQFVTGIIWRLENQSGFQKDPL